MAKAQRRIQMGESATQGLGAAPHPARLTAIFDDLLTACGYSATVRGRADKALHPTPPRHILLGQLESRTCSCPRSPRTTLGKAAHNGTWRAVCRISSVTPHALILLQPGVDSWNRNRQYYCNRHAPRVTEEEPWGAEG